MAGGEWWRVDGPWKTLGRAAERLASAAEAARSEVAGGSGEGASVYVPERPPVAEVPVAPLVEPEGTVGPGAVEYDPPALVVPPRPAAPPAVPAQREPAQREPAGRPAGAPPLSAADFPGWDSVVFDFSEVIAKAEAEAEAAPEAESEAEAVLAPEAAPVPGVKLSVLAGRRPSVVAVLAALLLLGGAVTGQFLALLAGWGLAYLAHRLGEWTRKFASVGIPLVTMASSTVWYWGREKGRWGSPLGPGQQFTHVTWAAAPGVLRVAGVLSAVFLLVVTFRRARVPR